MIWSAATSRRFGCIRFDGNSMRAVEAKAKAATSRRTPKIKSGD